MARFRSGIAAASTRTCSAVSGTIFSRRVDGSDSRTHGEAPICRSSTAAANTDRTNETRLRSVEGASFRDRSVTHAWTSDGRTSRSRRAPSGVPSMSLRMRLSTRRRVRGLCGRLAAYCRAFSATVVRSERSTYSPRSASASTVVTRFSASAFRSNALVFSWPSTGYTASQRLPLPCLAVPLAGALVVPEIPYPAHWSALPGCGLPALGPAVLIGGERLLGIGHAGGDVGGNRDVA